MNKEYYKQKLSLETTLYKNYVKGNEIIKDNIKSLIKVINNDFTEDSEINFLLVLNNSKEFKKIFNKTFNLSEMDSDSFKIGNNKITVRFLNHNVNMFRHIKINDYYITKPDEINKNLTEYREQILNEIIENLELI